jgi:hypothetical protein
MTSRSRSRAAAFGARYRLFDSADLGAVAEFPISGGDHIFGWRVTTDIILRFF